MITSTFVESLRRLYKANRLSLKKLKLLLKDGKITQDEYNYIIS